ITGEQRIQTLDTGKRDGALGDRRDLEFGGSGGEERDAVGVGVDEQRERAWQGGDDVAQQCFVVARRRSEPGGEVAMKRLKGVGFEAGGVGGGAERGGEGGELRACLCSVGGGVNVGRGQQRRDACDRGSGVGELLPTCTG